MKNRWGSTLNFCLAGLKGMGMYLAIKIKSRLIYLRETQWKTRCVCGCFLVVLCAVLLIGRSASGEEKTLTNPVGGVITGQARCPGTFPSGVGVSDTYGPTGMCVRAYGSQNIYNIINQGTVETDRNALVTGGYGALTAVSGRIIGTAEGTGSRTHVENAATGTVGIDGGDNDRAGVVFGIRSVADGVGSTASAKNDGRVDVTVGFDAPAVATVGIGMDLQSGTGGEAVNTGNITVNSKGYAYGIRVLSNAAASEKFVVSNTGTINVTADGARLRSPAHQLMVDGTGGRTGTTLLDVWSLNLEDFFSTSEDRRIFAVKEGATLEFGDKAGNGAHLILWRNGAEHVSSKISDMIYDYGTGIIAGTVGSIESPDTARDAYQLTLEGYDNALNQAVYIDRASQANLAGQTKTGEGCAFATCGLYSSTHGWGVGNAGNIAVTAAADTVGSGLFVNLRDTGVATTVDMINHDSGLVDVTASGAGAAYGFYARLQGQNQVANIDSGGIVTVNGPTAHQLFVQGRGNGIGGTGNLNRWNLALQDWKTDEVKPFAVADGATLNFNDTHLILRPGQDKDGFVMGKPYAIADMVFSNNGTVDGAIGSVSTPLPMLKASLNGSGWGDATVALNVVPQVSPGQIVNAAQTSFMRGQFNLLDAMLLSTDATDELGCEDDPRYCRKKVADGGDESSPVSLHVRPYYNHQSRDGFSGASTDATGVVLMGSRELDNGHRIGIHGGAGYANTLSNDRTLRSDAMTGLLGIHGIYHVRHYAYLRGQLSGAISINNNHFSDLQGTDWASNNAVGTGLYGAIYGGHRLRLKTGDIFLPEVGLTANWIHSPAMSINWQHNQDLNMQYKANDYVVLNGQASVRWIGAWDVGNTHVYPTVLAGVRQALTSTNIRASMTLADGHFNSAVKEDRTLGLAGVGLTVPLGETTSLSAAYFGEIGKTMTNHSGYLNLKMVF